MNDLRILVANEPRAYREVIAATVQALRPHVTVVAVDPTDLDGHVMRFDPHVVLCSRPGLPGHAQPLAWVILYPDGENRAEVRIAGKQAAVAAVEFDSLLCIVDRAERLAQLS